MRLPAGRKWRLPGAAACLLGLLAVTSGCAAQDGQSAGEPVQATAGAAEIDTQGERVGLPCPVSDLDAAPIAGGLPATDYECLGPGPDVNLAGLRGTPVVLNVWASWCPPCREEMPLFAELADRAGDRLVVLGLDVQDDREAGALFAAEVGVASAYDPLGRSRPALGWTGPPVTYFVDAQGQIVHRAFGKVPDQQTLDALVAEHLQVDLSDR